MPPEGGLVHLKEYDVKDSNVELIGSDIDHQVKYNSAATEPAWNDGKIGKEPGLFIWRIESFEVIAWPKEKYGQFHEGDSYIILHSYKIGNQGEEQKLGHDIFFWLGSKTTQDEAGTAAYKTVELDEFLKSAATQHREIQSEPSEEFLSLFPRLSILSGGVRSGFRHVEVDEADKPREILVLLRIFKHAAARNSLVVHEVEPSWQSLDEDDVFILEKGDKIWVWQGKNCSPMEKAKAAQVVHDMTLDDHVKRDVEVVSQNDARSRIVVQALGGGDVEQVGTGTNRAPRPLSSSKTAGNRPKSLFRLSDATGTLSFNLVKQAEPIQKTDLDGNDVFVLDSGSAIWVWQGLGASQKERAMWLKVAQGYVRQLEDRGAEAHLTPLAKVVEGHESPAFLKTLEV